MGKKRAADQVHVVAEHATGVQEASGVAALPDGSFLLVDDEEGIFRVELGREPEPVAAGRGFADLEGICVAHDGSRAWVLAERDGGVWSFDVDGHRLASGSRRGALPRVGREQNAGWEGLAFAPAGTWADSPRLVAVHQRKPRRVAVIHPESLDVEWSFRLPKAARKLLDDLNDVAVHPDSGELVILSGKAGRLARLRRVGDDVEVTANYRIHTSRNDVPEGIAYDAAGRLWVVWDGSGTLRQIELR